MQSSSAWSSWNEVLSFENSHFRFGQFRLFSERTLGILGQPSVPGFLNIRSSHVSLDRMLPRRGFFDASQEGLFQLPGYLNGLAVCIQPEQRGPWGNKHGRSTSAQFRGLLGIEMSFKKVRKVSHTSLPRIDPHTDERLD